MKLRDKALAGCGAWLCAAGALLIAQPEVTAPGWQFAPGTGIDDPLGWAPQPQDASATTPQAADAAEDVAIPQELLTRPALQLESFRRRQAVLAKIDGLLTDLNAGQSAGTEGHADAAAQVSAADAAAAKTAQSDALRAAIDTAFEAAEAVADEAHGASLQAAQPASAQPASAQPSAPVEAADAAPEGLAETDIARVAGAVSGRTARENAQRPTEAEALIHGEDGRQIWEETRRIDRAAFYYRQGEYILAEREYVMVLESTAPDDDKIRALTELAEVYVARGMPTMAVDTLESLLRRFPDVDQRPDIFFRLGELYRDLRLSEQSIGMFYRVLNAIVVTGDAQLQRYLNMARLAQFEIARAHYENGDYAQASLLFERINLLELEAVDRETVHYYKVRSALKAGKNLEALELVRGFIRDFTDSEYLAEMLYIESQLLLKMNRKEASAESLMRLLEAVGLPGEDNRPEWLYWRQQAGNELANRFYDEGNFMVALRIYQGMVGLENSPDWQLPIVYQIALCFEKLAAFERAKESYTYIKRELDLLEAEAPLSPGMAALRGSVEWREKVLSWRDEVATQIEGLALDGGADGQKDPS